MPVRISNTRFEQILSRLEESTELLKELEEELGASRLSPLALQIRANEKLLRDLDEIAIAAAKELA